MEPKVSVLRQWRHEGRPDLIVDALKQFPGSNTLHKLGIDQLSEICLDPDPLIVLKSGGMDVCLYGMQTWPNDTMIAWKACTVLHVLSSQSLHACRTLVEGNHVPALVSCVRLAQRLGEEVSKSWEMQYHALSALRELVTAGDFIGPRAASAMQADTHFEQTVSHAMSSFLGDARKPMLAEACHKLLSILRDSDDRDVHIRRQEKTSSSYRLGCSRSRSPIPNSRSRSRSRSHSQNATKTE